ncbi:MAG: ATP-binding protein [Acidimicrobiales bacterium]
MSLSCDGASVGAGRRAVGAELAHRGVTPEVVEVVELMASELITNAVFHTGGRVGLVVTMVDQLIRVEVTDDSLGRPVLRHPPADSTSGRGMEIVNTLASRWGVDELPAGGKSVWFEVVR